MKIIFLGSNGWYATKFGNTSCVLIKSDKYNIIFDAGDGLYKINDYIKDDKPIYLFLSHLHLDHIIGLHILSKFKFKQEIKIFGEKGTQKAIETIINHPFSVPIAKLPLKIQFTDLEEGKYNIPFAMDCKLLEHSDPCLGYNIMIENKSIVYCTDTKLCDNLLYLARNSDVFITECAYKPGQEEWGWPHLKPEEAASIAKEAGVGRLLITHFDASHDKTGELRKKCGLSAEHIFQNSSIMFDDDLIEI